MHQKYGVADMIATCSSLISRNRWIRNMSRQVRYPIRKFASRVHNALLFTSRAKPGLVQQRVLRVAQR